MRIAIKAEMIADMIVSTPITAKLYPYEFEVYMEHETLWLKVSKPVKDYEEHLPKVFMKHGTINIEIGKDDIFKDLLDWIQYIEAMGAFNIQIERIYWDRPTYCWIPETKEEHLQTPLSEYSKIPKKGRKPKRLTSSNLFNIVAYRHQLKDIDIPFTYFKEGQRFFNNFNYYFAFINFFMMLEYCFAEGKFKKVEMIQSFKNSQLLRLCILEYLNLSENTNVDWLKKECKKRNKNLDVDGVIYLLVTYRGELSHASTKSEKHYRKDEVLKPLVVVISTICFLACGNLQISMFMDEKQKEEWLIRRLTELKDKNE